MRLSTGIILSILSANVFAIEHPNGAHPGSLLARRAVVADADAPFLQKRNNDGDKEEQEEQAKPKVSSAPNPDFSQKPYVYVKDAFKDDPNLDPNPSDDTKDGPIDFPEYVPDQDDETKDERENVYAGLDPGQGRTSFADALGDSPSQVLGHIKKELSRAKLKVGLFYGTCRASRASDKVWLDFGGLKGKAMGDELYKMLSYALETPRNYRILYKDSARSPFRLELPSTIPDESKKTYKRLQKKVLKSIEKHITTIDDTIGSISVTPWRMITWLKVMMSTIDGFYKVIIETKSEYSSLLVGLGISDDMNLEGLEVHIKVVEKHKLELYDRFNKIVKMVEDYRTNLKQRSTSKFLSSIRKSKGRPEVESKPSGDGVSGSAQSNDAVVGDLIDFQ
ncbi:hypothetical protein BASA61_004559 [Batrachochytrium salamandrivorans]|nr:hypothetical protein BASA61_004559 [Batrachochytrium salamandrivorans]